MSRAAAEKRKVHNRSYYENGGAARIRAAKKAHQRRNVEYLRHIKETTPCADCGEKYPYYVMDFDHLRLKEATLSRLAYRPVSIARLDAEIDKCEVVCANCHRRRTHERSQHPGSAG